MFPIHLVIKRLFKFPPHPMSASALPETHCTTTRLERERERDRQTDRQTDRENWNVGSFVMFSVVYLSYFSILL